MLADVVTRAGKSAINVLARTSVHLSPTMGIGDEDRHKACGEGEDLLVGR